MTLSALSLNRMMCFVNIGNFDGKLSSYMSATKIICFVWLYSLALSLPPVIGWGRYLPEISGLGYIYYFNLLTNKYILHLVLINSKYSLTVRMFSFLYFFQMHTRLALKWKVNFICCMDPYSRVSLSQLPYCNHIGHHMLENKRSKLMRTKRNNFQKKPLI